MKVKSFRAYLEKRLRQDEVADIERAAQLEHKVLKGFLPLTLAALGLSHGGER